jgi:glucose-6-phosphate 1-dehydrogenase
MAADRVDALVTFGATGDLAKLETFPALVGRTRGSWGAVWSMDTATCRH